MERWEAYALGALGLTLALVSIVMQVAWLTVGKPWPALGLTLGIAGGALLYRTGYRGINRP